MVTDAERAAIERAIIDAAEPFPETPYMDVHEYPSQPPADFPAELCWPPKYGRHRFGCTNPDTISRGVFDTWLEAWASTLSDFSRLESQYFRHVRAQFTVVPVSWKDQQRVMARNSRLVWADETWWHDAIEIRDSHFTAVSEQDKTLIAYVQNEAKGQRGVRTPIKPGRYLSKYFGDVLTPKQIAFWATWQATGDRPSEYGDAKSYPLAFAKSADEIVDVYRRGPESCMKKDFSCSGHPARVYAAGDLAVAYLSNSGGVPIARALCWPENKIVGRVYPTPENWRDDGFESYDQSKALHDTLERRLLAEGYQSIYTHRRGFDGARVLRIHARGDNYVMPYLDCGLKFSESGNAEYFELSVSGDYSSDNTNGLARINDEDKDEDEEPEYPYVCENCDDGCNETYQVYTRSRRRQPQDWCDHCRYNQSFRCEGSEDYYSDTVPSETICGDIYELGWLQENAVYTERSGWSLDETETVKVIATVDCLIETWLLSDAEKNAFRCAISDAWITEEAAVRCAVTGRLVSPLRVRTDRPDVASDVTDSELAYHDGQLALPISCATE